LLTATRGTSQMVEEFETLTLVHKALDLKTRDLVELGISDSATRHGHIASATTRIVTIDALNREGEYRIRPIVDMPRRLEGG
jgi:phosphoenolpyruvate carboxylase